MNSEEHDFTNAHLLRRKAEKLLREKQAKADALILETDAKKLLHELQVHQIELEMQNEELHKAYDVAETALKKYTMLYDLAPMGYFTLESDGRISELNFTAADMLKERRFSLINSNFKFYIADRSKADFHDFFTKIFASTAKESCELVLGNDKNPLCTVYVEGIVTDDDKKCLLSVVDISNFKK